MAVSSASSSTPSTPSSGSLVMNGQGERFPRRASIVLIGMRGVGKTTLGTLAAKALGWRLIDTDSVFEARQGQTITSYVPTHGWEAFRNAEADILDETLHKYPTCCIIACGGGIVELERNRITLQHFRDNTGPVIHVLREREAVLHLLRASTHFHPPYPHETDAEVWERRAGLFRACCSHEFVSLTCPVAESQGAHQLTPEQTLALKPVEDDFFRLLRFIHGIDTKRVTLWPRGPRSYFLALTFDDVTKAIPVIDTISVGIDMWELRVDLLKSYDPTFLAFQIATLRRHSPLPILFTLRTVSQGGRYPDLTDQKSIGDLRNLLHHALRLGVEYIDLELTFPESVFTEIVRNKGGTTIIGSHHDWTGSISWLGFETRHIYDSIVRRGADIVKIVNTAKSFEDNMTLRKFAATVEGNGTPLLAINMGEQGKISRVLNPVLSPVSHPALPNPSAPGQISYLESQSMLYLTGLLQPKKFYILGALNTRSMSPILHNTAFAALGLPHTYELVEAKSCEDFGELLRTPSFGGASVTRPHNRAIGAHLQHLSSHARIVGAVNTVFPLSSHGLAGDNTEWRAIRTCALRSLSPANTVTSDTTALIIGAGAGARAAVYALYRIGVVRFSIYNRTVEKARTLAQELGKLDKLMEIRVLTSLVSPLPVHAPPTVVVSSIPAITTPDDGEDAVEIDVGLLPEHLGPAGGVAIELAYNRRKTKLLALVEENSSKGWVGVEGIEVLLEQAYEQCKIWTGRRAPVTNVREKVFEAYTSFTSGA